MTKQEIKYILYQKGVNPSQQRIEILKYLVDSKNHPSADIIYKDLSNNFPTLSKMTIYNTLNLLVEKNIVTSLKINDKEVIFDFIEEKHAHFKCTVCNEIFDIKLDSDILSKRLIDGDVIHETQINYFGICKKCNIVC